MNKEQLIAFLTPLLAPDVELSASVTVHLQLKRTNPNPPDESHLTGRLEIFRRTSNEERCDIDVSPEHAALPAKDLEKWLRDSIPDDWEAPSKYEAYSTSVGVTTVVPGE